MAENNVDEEFVVPQWDEKAFLLEEEAIWAKERECLLLLLEARTLLRAIVDWDHNDWDFKLKRKKEEMKEKGELSLMEIADILQRMPGGDDFDLASELARLKRLVIQEIKKGHVLEGNLGKLDLKISLMISNKGTTHDIQAKRKEAWLTKLAQSSQRKREAKEKGEQSQRFELPSKKQELYGELFYMLQTEPRYMAKCLYLLQPQQVEQFLDSTIITLFGEAFSPREEFLILSLFLSAMEQEIGVVKSVQDFLSADSVVPKLLITYNRRMQGVVYLRNTLPQVLKLVQDDASLDLELNPVMIHQSISPGTNVTEDQALDNPEVKKAITKRIADLERVCKAFFDAIFLTMDKLPYGLRWICKMMRTLCEKRLPDVSKDDILRLTGYFVYYRFINVALLSPEAFKISAQLGTRERKNLIVVGKVLQKAFNLKSFTKAEKSLIPLNGFIDKIKPDLIQYFNNLVQVTDPEDFLQVDQYLELTRKERPTVIINLTEVVAIHKLLWEKQESLAGADDPFRQIMKELGPPPTDLTESDNREVTLVLNNRFKKEVKEDEQNIQIYAETKELCLPILRAIPITASLHQMNLVEVLEHGQEYATKAKNTVLHDQCTTVLKNLAILEKAGLVNAADDYRAFIKDVAIEVANRAVIRERQKKEIQRLTTTLSKLQKNSQFTTDQIAEYEKYLSDALKKQYEGKKPKDLHKPQKFGYKKLYEMGVIIDSEIPPESRKGSKFEWAATDTSGVFEVTVRVDKSASEKITIRLDDLLEKHHSNQEKLDAPPLSLDVNMTLYLINKHILT